MTTQPYPTRDELVTAAQRLDAELSVLGLYDDARRDLGHDYGNGQRYSELVRVRRQRDAARKLAKIFGYGMGLGELDATPQQCLEAYGRISAPRMARYRRESYRGETAMRSVTAWARALREIERTVAAEMSDG
jgi:hypothetical protein